MEWKDYHKAFYNLEAIRRIAPNTDKCSSPDLGFLTSCQCTKIIIYYSIIIWDVYFPFMFFFCFKHKWVKHKDEFFV